MGVKRENDVGPRALFWAALITTATVAVARSLTSPRVQRGGRILVLGDSMAQALFPPLKQLAEESGISIAPLYEQGTRIDQWASRQSVDQALRTVQPSLVLVVLGTNDEYLGGDGASKQAPALTSLLAKLRASGASVAWVGPPTLPRPTNGVRALLEQRLGNDYFDSKALLIPRAPDNIHPTTRGAAGWAGAVWRWLT